VSAWFAIGAPTTRRFLPPPAAGLPMALAAARFAPAPPEAPQPVPVPVPVPVIGGHRTFAAARVAGARPEPGAVRGAFMGEGVAAAVHT
jgi:hypothetical protein